MSMTKQDYERIARTIKSIRQCVEWEFPVKNSEHLLDIVSESLATALAVSNPRFNEQKFLEVCGIRPQEKE